MVDACPACSVKYYIQGSTLGAEKLVVCTVFIFNGRVLCSMYIKFIFIREHLLLQYLQSSICQM